MTDSPRIPKTWDKTTHNKKELVVTYFFLSDDRKRQIKEEMNDPGSLAYSLKPMREHSTCIKQLLLCEICPNEELPRRGMKEIHIACDNWIPV